MMPNSLRPSCFLSLICLITASTNAAAQWQFDDHRFDFHGYARGGLLTSSGGSTAAEFFAPGAGAKFRLGNESDVQLRLRMNYLYGSNTKMEPYFKAVLAVEDYQRLGNSNEFKLDRVPKAWLEFGNLSGTSVSFWLGRRWYERRGAYLNDYWWVNSGQKSNIGAGLEGINLGPGELKLAIFNHRDDKVAGVGTVAGATGTVTATTVDARFEKIPVTDSASLNFWGIYANRDKQEDLNFSNETGWGIGSWWEQEGVLGGKNTLAMTYRAGAAMHRNTYNARPVTESMGYDLSNSSQWELHNSWRWDDKTNYAIEGILLARSRDFGQAGVSGEVIRWYSVGARPMMYLSKQWNLVADVGIDYVDNEIQGVKGNVSKTSLALQLSADKGYMSRPALRLFMTYARWSDDLVGLVGSRPDDAPYGDDSQGWSAGLQLEHIW